MKILHTVEFYYPSIGGAQEVVRHLSERMAKMGHDVTVATTRLPNRRDQIINGVKIKEFDISGNEVRGYTGETSAYKKWLLESDFDVIMLYAAQQWTVDLFDAVIDDIKAKKVLVPCGFSALYDPAYSFYFKKMPSVLKKYDATVYLSDNYRDINFARKNNVENIKIVPNGADENEFAELLPKKNNRTIVTVGNHTGEKGHRESLLAFLLSPIRNARLLIIGGLFQNQGCSKECLRLSKLINVFAPITKKTVSIMELPREETVRALKAADLFLFLSRIEASPLVLFEAAAAGTPFLASSAGNSEEISKWLGSGIIVSSKPVSNGRVKPSIMDAAKKISQLFKDEKRLAEMGKTGHETFKEKYSWQKITGDYLELYQDLLSRTVPA